jgi:hypothetical protein
MATGEIVCFLECLNEFTRRKEVSRNLRNVIMKKCRIKDQDMFNKAYWCVEQYY